MGSYSRKDMIEFANFAKSYQSSKKVEVAYKAYLKGDRLVTKSNDLIKTASHLNELFGLKPKIRLTLTEEHLKDKILEGWSFKVSEDKFPSFVNRTINKILKERKK